MSTAGKSLIFCFSLINHLYHYYDSSLTQNAQLEVCGTPAVINAVHFRMRVYSGVKPNKLKATNRDVLELNIFPAQVWNKDVSLEPQRGEFTEDGCLLILKTRPTPTREPAVPTPGHLARGSKALWRSNQSSHWATPLIQFYFISGQPTTRGVGTFPGSCGPGVILSLNDPRSGSNCLLRDQVGLTRWEDCVIVMGRETKTDIAHLLVG